LIDRKVIVAEYQIRRPHSKTANFAVGEAVARSFNLTMNPTFRKDFKGDGFAAVACALQWPLRPH